MASDACIAASRTWSRSTASTSRSTPAELKHRVQRESIFRIELDRLHGGAAALARLPGVVSATPELSERDDDDAHIVAVNLVLADDGALRGVVSAIVGQGSHILALRMSETTLEDVFVELVGRGFEDAGDGDDRDGDGRPAPPGRVTDDHTTTAEDEAEVREPELVR